MIVDQRKENSQCFQLVFSLLTHEKSRPRQRVSWNRCWLEVDKYRDMLMGDSTLVNLQLLMVYIYIQYKNILWYHFVPRPHSAFYILYSVHYIAPPSGEWPCSKVKDVEKEVCSTISRQPGKGGHWSSATSLLDDIGGWCGKCIGYSILNSSLTWQWLKCGKWRHSCKMHRTGACHVLQVTSFVFGTNCPVFSLSSPTELLQEALPSMRAVNPYAGHHNEFEIKCLSKKWASHHNNTNRKVPIATWKDICWMEFRSYVQETIHVVPTQTTASGQSEIDGANDREGKGWLVAGLLWGGMMATGSMVEAK